VRHNRISLAALAVAAAVQPAQATDMRVAGLVAEGLPLDHAQAMLALNDALAGRPLHIVLSTMLNQLETAGCQLEEPAARAELGRLLREMAGRLESTDSAQG